MAGAGDGGAEGLVAGGGPGVGGDVDGGGLAGARGSDDGEELLIACGDASTISAWSGPRRWPVVFSQVRRAASTISGGTEWLMRACACRGCVRSRVRAVARRCA